MFRNLGCRRAAPPTTRYVYAVASDRPLRITDRSFDDDYMRFARMLLNEGTLDGARILKPSTVKLMTAA